jgi:hypothetical protein
MPKRRDRDDDEYDDEDDDDRPRRKRRRDDDEDDDDRPRKGSGRETLPPGTPQLYVHKRCKCETKMPTDVIREYLDNPFELGEEPTTYCSECEEDVPWKECHWADTRQNLYDYIDDLRAEMVVNGTDPRSGEVPYNFLTPVIAAVIGGCLAGGIGSALVKGLAIVAVVAAGIVGGALVGLVWMPFERKKDQAAQDEWNRKLVKRYYKRHPDRQPPQKSKRRSNSEDDE